MSALDWLNRALFALNGTDANRLQLVDQILRDGIAESDRSDHCALIQLSEGQEVTDVALSTGQVLTWSDTDKRWYEVDAIPSWARQTRS